MTRFASAYLLPVMLLVSTTMAFAHKPSDSYLNLSGEGTTLSVRWDIALKDLELLLGLDADGDGAITWGELRSQRAAVVATATSHLKLAVDDSSCPLVLTDLAVAEHGDGTYAVLEFATPCAGDAATVDVEYDLLFAQDPTHRGLLRYRNAGIEQAHVLRPGQPSIRLRTGLAARWPTFTHYLREGVWHIWIGLDHVLFLLTLLLPAVLVWQGHALGRWEPAPRFRVAAGSVVKTVTAFTVAHSITLWLAATATVALPSTLVEAAIALSIVVTALNNVYRFAPLSGWMVAFGFGLVHGFGFANVLDELGLGSVTLAVALVGFNIGVEIGQLCIVLVFLPAAFALRRTAFYQRGLLVVGSWLAAAVATYWFIERATL